MTRRYNPRLAKPHLSYTRAELCETFKVALPTIWKWTLKGLRPIDEKRPYLFAGRDVQQFLERHNKPRQPTAPGEIYCVACKRVIVPESGVVDFNPLGPSSGNLIGTCPRCSRRIYQRVRKADIARKAGNLMVRYEDDAATLLTGGEPLHTASSAEVTS